MQSEAIKPPNMKERSKLPAIFTRLALRSCRAARKASAMLVLLPMLAGNTLAAQHQADSTKTVNDTTLMREITVNGLKQSITYRLDRKRIDAAQVLTAQGGTALDVLRQLPSVQVDADGELTLRGSSGFLVYVDGKPSPLTGTEALQMIAAASIKSIDVLTTPPAKYKV